MSDINIYFKKIPCEFDDLNDFEKSGADLSTHYKMYHEMLKIQEIMKSGLDELYRHSYSHLRDGSLNCLHYYISLVDFEVNLINLYIIPEKNKFRVNLNFDKIISNTKLKNIKEKIIDKINDYSGSNIINDKEDELKKVDKDFFKGDNCMNFENYKIEEIELNKLDDMALEVALEKLKISGDFEFYIKTKNEKTYLVKDGMSLELNGEQFINEMKNMCIGKTIKDIKDKPLMKIVESINLIKSIKMSAKEPDLNIFFG